MDKSGVRIALALTTGLMVIVGVVILLNVWGHAPPAAHAQAGTGVIRVATTGADVADCGGVANPCRTVQYAVDQAQPGDEVRVATGTYTDIHSHTTPPGYTDPPPGGLITQVVYLDKAVTIRGGYTTADWNTSDPDTNPTTLDAQAQGRVLVAAGDVSPTVEGLRITGGDADGLDGEWGSDAGGGVFVLNAAVTLNGNEIYNNTADIGGGVWVGGTNGAVLNSNYIHDNTAGVDLGQGGGIALSGSNSITMDNNLIVANYADHEGGGALLEWSTAILRHNTIARNRGGDGSGVSVILGSSVAMTNTILVSHTVGIAIAPYHTPCTADLESTLWATGTAWANVTPWVNNGTLTHNHDYPGDPAFVDPDAGDYHIGGGSAARDVGVDAGVVVDIDGEARPQGIGYDIGADEWHPTAACREDVNDDGVINIVDIQMVAAGWGGSDPDLDMEPDGDVDVDDIGQVAGRWGESCP